VGVCIYVPLIVYDMNHRGN